GVRARRAPGGAFIAAVATALSVATPGVAAAASIGLSQTATGGKLLAGLGVTGVTAGAAAGFLGGLFGGLGGVFAGAHELHREARDDRERRGAKVYAAAATTLMLIF